MSYMDGHGPVKKQNEIIVPYNNPPSRTIGGSAGIRNAKRELASKAPRCRVVETTQPRALLAKFASNIGPSIPGTRAAT